jgi:hypothetical protein
MRDTLRLNIEQDYHRDAAEANRAEAALLAAAAEAATHRRTMEEAHQRAARAAQMLAGTPRALTSGAVQQGAEAIVAVSPATVQSAVDGELQCSTCREGCTFSDDFTKALDRAGAAPRRRSDRLLPIGYRKPWYYKQLARHGVTALNFASIVSAARAKDVTKGDSKT